MQEELEVLQGLQVGLEPRPIMYTLLRKLVQLFGLDRVMGACAQ